MGNVELIIQNGSKIYYPVVEEDITWETERKGSPGKLTFKVVPDGVLDFQEGNAVRLKVNGANVFYGFVFSKKRSKDKIISVVAYDQLRYFKNKDTYVYKNKTASDLVKMFAADFNLKAGTIENTEHIIASRVEDNKTLFDMVQNALDITLQSKNKMYVLFDDFGKIALKNVESMKLNIVVGEDTVEDFDYQSSIDGDTYNKIKLSYANKETGKREIYITQDSSNMNAWGTLQYYDSLQEHENGQAKADALLKLYNRKKRTLTVKNALGDTRARAGTSVIVYIKDLGDIKVQNYMLVEKAKHIFKNDEHFMNLTLRGGDFIA